ESYELIITVEKNGKNWAKNLEQLHSKHLFTNINDPSTLRKHYNGLASEKSSLYKPYKQPKLVFEKGLTENQKREREIEFATEHERIKRQREHALELIKKIE